jgi:hypothetical protein
MKKIYLTIATVLAITIKTSAQSTNDVLNLLIQKNVVNQKDADSLRAEDAIKQQDAAEKRKVVPVTIGKAFQLSGFIQSQFQKADTIGSPGKYSGGNFSGLDNRFQVRRGRLKAEYNNELSKYVLQIDVTEKGVALKDAYGSFTDRWLRTFTLTAGAFGRPFGNEINYSSASLESPERARIIQALFPNEEDLGAQLAIEAPSSPFNFIKLQGGFFTGNGLFPETDKYKDFIGQVILKKSFLDDKLLLSGGASYYNGGFAALTPNGKIDATSKGKPVYAYIYEWKNAAFAKDSITGGAKLKREYIGFDLQATLKSGLGNTSIKGEYIFGTQPGTASINYSPTNDQPVVSAISDSITSKTSGKPIQVLTTSTAIPASSNYYSRSFNGGYVTFVQTILQTKHDIVVKYDWYDPNTNVAGNVIGAGDVYDAKLKKLTKNPTLTSGADIKYSTLGLGWIYRWNPYVKITIFYELVSNETTNSGGLNASLVTTASGVQSFAKDQKDNVWTFRVQYKF